MSEVPTVTSDTSFPPPPSPLSPPPLPPSPLIFFSSNSRFRYLFVPLSLPCSSFSSVFFLSSTSLSFRKYGFSLSLSLSLSLYLLTYRSISLLTYLPCKSSPLNSSPFFYTHLLFHIHLPLSLFLILVTCFNPIMVISLISSHLHSLISLSLIFHSLISHSSPPQ